MLRKWKVTLRQTEYLYQSASGEYVAEDKRDAIDQALNDDHDWDTYDSECSNSEVDEIEDLYTCDEEGNEIDEEEEDTSENESTEDDDNPQPKTGSGLEPDPPL